MRRERPDPERTDILNLLLAARDEQGNPMTNEELRDELVTALFEMKLVLATILSQHQLKLIQQAPVVPIRRGVTIAPRGAIHFTTE